VLDIFILRSFQRFHSSKQDFIHLQDLCVLLLCLLLYAAPAPQGLPLLVFANKMDLPDALQPAELAEQMQLPQVAQRAFHIRGCSALRNEGVQEGMKWLAGQLQQG
jgi:signal recognition particle receptor subunit beta